MRNLERFRQISILRKNLAPFFPPRPLIVLVGIAISGLFEPVENQPLMMSSEESWHLVDECVISPLHSSLEVTPEDLVSRVSQVDFGHLRALSSSTTLLSSSKRRRDANLKAAIASLQAKQLAERVKRDNEVREQEFQEETA